MKAAIHISFPDFADPASRTTIEAGSGDLSASVKNITIVLYHLSVIRLNTPRKTPVTVEIKKTGLYLFILETGSFIMERTGADDIRVPAATDDCQALYLHEGTYTLLFPRGQHRLVCFAADATWISLLKPTLPVMTAAFSDMLSHEQAIIFPRYKLPETFSRELLALPYQPASAIRSEQLSLFHALNHILEYYDTLLSGTR